jgi:hypothetical protein
MKITTTLLSTLFLVSSCQAQFLGVGARKTFGVPVLTIVRDTPSCATGGPTPTGCTLTSVAAGDFIDCHYFDYAFAPPALYIADSVNGAYYPVYNRFASANESIGEYVQINSAAGTITPTIHANTMPYGAISCQTYKNINNSGFVDASPIWQFASSTSTNPNSGTARTPSYNKELVTAFMEDDSGTATAGSGYTMAATTGIGSLGYNLYSEYSIQTTAASTNGSFTNASTDWLDMTAAFVPSGQVGGVIPFGGLYWDGAGETNGTTVSAANLATGGNSAFPGGWGGTYSTGVYTTSVSVPARTHSVWAGGKYSTTNTNVALDHISVASESFNWDTVQAGPTGEAPSLSFFFQTTYTGTSVGNLCDMAQIASGGSDGVNLQTGYDATAHLGMHMEITNGTTQTSPWVSISPNTWYWISMQLASTGNHKLYIYRFSGGVWSLLGTSTYAVTTGASSTVNFQIGDQGSCGDPSGTHVYYADIQADPWGQAGFPVLP